jgi:hypothetical protein
MSSLLVFNRVNRLEIQAMCDIFDPSCELLPLYLLYDLPHPSLLPKVNAHYMMGGGVLSCVVDHILQEFSTLFLTRF